MSYPFRAVPPKTRPEDVTPEDFAALCRNPQCAHLERCGGVPCADVNENGEYPVEVDHIHPKTKEGWSDLDNLQLLCPHGNRSKYINPDPNYAASNYFDADFHGEFDVEKLRPHQLLKAYNLVRHDYRDLFSRPGKLLKLILLLAWLVGAGKTIGVVAILMAWNHVRLLESPAPKRAKRVLWLVHQATLVRALTVELAGDPSKGVESDLVKYGLVKSPPRVNRVETVDDWNNDSTDITAACTQALWDVPGRKLTDERRREILSSYDVIVIDENQFGVERYMQILHDAPQALKIGISATPMDADGTLLCDLAGGKYRNRFAILSTFPYEEGREQQIYKEVVPFDVGLDDVYHAVTSGDATIQTGMTESLENNPKLVNDLPRKFAVMHTAVAQAKLADQETDYDNHIMVRVGGITEAKALLKELQSTQADPKHKEIVDIGVTGVWSGSKGPNLGDSNHSWMKAKRTGGKCKKGCTRLVITIDIGQFGINNRYCSVIAWVEPNMSQVELVQRIGRAIRNDGERGRVRLVWRSVDSRFEERLREALEYILDMPNRLTPFLTLDTIQGEKFGKVEIPVAPKLRSDDRLLLAELLGNTPESERENLEPLISKWKESRESEPTEDQIRIAREFLSESRDDHNYRDRMFNLPSAIQFNGASFVKKESPPDSYSLERMCSEIKQGVLGLDVSQEDAIARLMSGDTLVTSMVASRVRERDERIYAIPKVCFTVLQVLTESAKNGEKVGILSYGAELTRAINVTLKKTIEEKDKDKIKARNIEIGSHVQQVMYTCAAKVFRLPNMQKKTYQSFEPQLVDAMLRPQARQAILGLAMPAVIDRLSHYFPGASKLYEDQIRDVMAYLGS